MDGRNQPPGPSLWPPRVHISRKVKFRAEARHEVSLTRDVGIPSGVSFSKLNTTPDLILFNKNKLLNSSKIFFLKFFKRGFLFIF